jgi:cell fate (sporulation/competence/biofilm development) regulator YlbF (YheA/YmcA/DUF963 family)
MSLVLEKAAELAAALENCEELKEVKAKQEALRGDAEAEEILASFFQMQQQLYTLQEQGQEPDPELTAQFNEIQDKMENNQAVAAFYNSQAALGQILQQINQIITSAITGEEECTPDQCASCSGC